MQTFHRETFSTSRLLEFCSERELVAQTGHPVAEWPLVILKEGADNGTDAAEEAGIAPELEVCVDTSKGEIVIADNGPGIPTATIDGIIDYSVRVSSREAYVSPTRGQQGNALKTIAAMGFALDPDIGETLCIESDGTAHRISFGVDAILREPRVSLVREPSFVKFGTRITVRLGQKASALMVQSQSEFLQIAESYRWFNPHLAVAVRWDGALVIDYEALKPEWEKWLPTYPIPAHWYTPERFTTLIAACVVRDRQQGRVRPVREFLTTFQGLSATAKQRDILESTGLAREPLDVFFRPDGSADEAGIADLLRRMQSTSKPPNPETLGVIGNFPWRLFLRQEGADVGDLRPFHEQGTYKYAKISGSYPIGENSVPYVVEAGFAVKPTLNGREFRSGFNWSPSLGRLFLTEAIAAMNSADCEPSDPVSLILHVATPVASFTDRGKANVALVADLLMAVRTAIRRVVGPWAKAARKREQQAIRESRDADRAIREAAPRERQRWNRDNTFIGNGPLHQEIEAAAHAEGLEVKDLLVLSKSNDPYSLDTVAGHAEARWFKEQVERFVDPTKRVHLRGLFYMVIGQGDIRRPVVSKRNKGNRPIVVNSFTGWQWFQKTSKAARWLVDPTTNESYVEFNRIRDQRNEEARYEAYADEPADGSVSIGNGAPIVLPNFEHLLPQIVVEKPTNQQPFRLVFIVEKSSAADDLDALAREVKADLVSVTGESSDTRIHEMVARAAEDDRELAVYYVSDFDPSGRQMAISVARKLQALRTYKFPELEFRLIPVALTREQAERFNLPSTPLKPKEKRRDKWVEKMGREQTEIDALIAQYPGQLERITRKRLEPYYDFTLDQRCQEAVERLEAEAYEKLNAHPAWRDISSELEKLHSDIEEAITDFEDARDRAIDKLQEGEEGIADIKVEAPEIEINAEEDEEPLISSDDDFITASYKLQDAKAYLNQTTLEDEDEESDDEDEDEDDDDDEDGDEDEDQ